MTCPRTSLALGGGGARGLAHLGVIEVLLEAGFTVERIVGISIGSLAGALYAFDPDIHRVQQKVLDYLLSPKFQVHQPSLCGPQASNGGRKPRGILAWYHRIQDYLRANAVCHRVMHNPSLLPGGLLQDIVEHLLPDADIADATIPLTIVAVDLLSGQKVTLEKGPLRDAVRASSSVPGVFPPVPFDRMLLCDIGVLNSIPTTDSRSYPTKCLVAVDVSSRLEPLSDCSTGIDVLMRMHDVSESLFRQHVCATADLTIRPDVGGIKWFDFSSSPQLIEAGRAAARAAVPRLMATCCASSTSAESHL